jgi:hypothetical protein
LRPQEPNRFFANQRSSQPFVEGTIARGTPYQDIPLNTGRRHWVQPTGWKSARLKSLKPSWNEGGNATTSIAHPVMVQREMAKVSPRNMEWWPWPTFMMPVLVSMTDGEIFNTITFGKNLMGPYGANIKIEDRWSIIAYLRALQRSRLSTMDDVPEPQKAALQN